MLDTRRYNVVRQFKFRKLGITSLAAVLCTVIFTQYFLPPTCTSSSEAKSDVHASFDSRVQGDGDKIGMVLRANIRKRGPDFACCVQLLPGGKAELESLWDRAEESKGLACNLLYRGLGIHLGRIAASDIVSSKPEGHLNCVQVPKQHAYLLLRDGDFERFASNLTSNISAYESKMSTALDITKNIKTFGASRQDGKHKLAPFVDSALGLEKPLPHVEIGSAWGSSGAATTVFATLQNFPQNSKIYMISPLAGFDTSAFNKVLEEQGQRERAVWVNSRQWEVPWSFGPVRSIFEDTNHFVETVSITTVLISRYLVEGGLASFHDVRCPKPYPGLAWAFDQFVNSPGWSEVVYPFEEIGHCNCTGREGDVSEGCNYVRTLRRRVTQPPLGVRVVVQGNPKGTTFKDLEAKAQFHELASFRFYQDFFSA